MAPAENVSAQPIANAAHHGRPSEKHFPAAWSPFSYLGRAGCWSQSLHSSRKKKKRRGRNLCSANPAEVFWLLPRTTKTATRILISSFWKLSLTIPPSTTQPPRPAFHWPHAGPRNHVINSLICHLRVGHDGSPSAAHLLLCGKTPGAALSIYPIMKYPRSAN